MTERVKRVPIPMSPSLQAHTSIMIMKGAIRDCITLSSLRRELPPTDTSGRNRAQIMCNTSGAHHVQHVCPVLRRGNSDIKLDLKSHLLFYFILFIFIRGWGGRAEREKETGVPGDEIPLP